MRKQSVLFMCSAYIVKPILDSLFDCALFTTRSLSLRKRKRFAPYNESKLKLASIYMGVVNDPEIDKIVAKIRSLVPLVGLRQENGH